MPGSRDALLLVYKRRRGARLPLVRASPYRVLYFASMLVLIALAGWLYLHQASEVAAQAREIRRQEWEKEWLHRDMVALQADIAMLGSLERLQAVAREHGYTLPEITDTKRRMEIRYIARPTSPPSPEPFGSLAESSLVASQSLYKRWAQQVEEWLRSPVAE